MADPPTNTIISAFLNADTCSANGSKSGSIADSELNPAGIPINYRPPFRFEAGHDSNQLSAGFRL